MAMQNRSAVNVTQADQCLDDFRAAFALGVPLEERLRCGSPLVPALDVQLAGVNPNMAMQWLDTSVLFTTTGYGSSNISSGTPAVLLNGPPNCVANLDYTDLQTMPQVGKC
jgi:hypothetical protein